jgi:hypothetical protein
MRADTRGPQREKELMLNGVRPSKMRQKRILTQQQSLAGHAKCIRLPRTLGNLVGRHHAALMAA